MLLEAYSPLGVGRVFEVPEVRAMAEKYGRSIAQVCMSIALGTTSAVVLILFILPGLLSAFDRWVTPKEI